MEEIEEKEKKKKIDKLMCLLFIKRKEVGERKEEIAEIKRQLRELGERVDF